MKKIRRNIFFFIIAFVFFLGLAPRLFFLDKVRMTISEQISKSLATSVTIKKMHWVWLPLPHLTLTDTSLTDSHYDFFLPKVKVYPTWKFILGETDKPGKIVLNSPRFHINRRAFLPRESPQRILPEVTLIINKGVLEIESTEKYGDILRSGSLTFSDIRGALKLQPQEIEVNINGSSPFSKKISVAGSLTIPERNYKFSLDAQDVKLHKVVNALFNGRLTPVESPARLAGTVAGKGLQQFEGNLHGTLPSLLAKHGDREILLACGYTDLKFIKSGPLLHLDIHDLEIKDPQMNISGEIERKFSVKNSEGQSPAADSVWTLDLIGSDLDLTALRRNILTLWGENKIAKTVTDIVLEGRALSAAYRFSGPVMDLKNLDAMIIEADLLNTDIHVPGAALDLTKASGPIQIKDSILTGHSLSAQLGNSYGHNAELFLDLGNLGATFKLVIDIDADLAALPPILARLVKHNGFQRQLEKFTEVSGKASGTLHLGDTLNEIITRVDVKNMQLETRYEPLPQAVSVSSGALQVRPGNVSWHKAKGRIGQQKISSTSGNVSWLTGETILHIEEIQGQLQGAPLHAMLKQTKVMPQKINTVLASIEGAIGVSRGSLRGPPMKPGSWEYDLALNTSGLAITTPLLPEQISTDKLRAEISHNEADLQDADIRFLDQGFNLKGLLKHHLLENWYGMIEFNGPVQSKLASWLSSKGWFPDKLRPKIPCTMKNMKVSWQGETVAVSGAILQGLDGGRLPMAKIDYENSPEHLHINELSFYASGEQGRLELDFWRRSPHSLLLSWDGFVNANTIDALFHHSSFTEGTISGDFALDYFADRPEATRFEGLLKAGNLLMKTSSSDEPFVITSLDMAGIGRQLRIPALALAIGSEKINGSGQLAAEKDGLQLDISLASPFLSKTSLKSMSMAMRETLNVFLQKHSDQKPGLPVAKGWDITGRIGFDFDSFAFKRISATPYDEAQTVTHRFYDVHGDLQIAPDKISRTEIFSAKLCGLDFKGFWYSNDNLGQNFELHTAPNETFYLEKVLPCLGVQQDIVEGEFSLQANLLKESDTWHSGKIHIKSSQGRILRLKTLSKILKVVNITDLFQEEVDSSGKRGFPFSQMDIETHIDANNLIFDRAIVRGEGLNLFARGVIHLDDYDTDLTLLISPFKTFDTIVSKVPIIGQPVTGEDGSMVSIPVAVKGHLTDPAITPLHPEAISDALLNIVKDTFMLPFNILKPLGQSEKKEQQ